MHSTGEETDSMSKVIGIDLGTTNSCVAVVEGGKPVVITNAEGERTTPSVVAFTKDGERLVGGAAKRQIATNSGRTISSIKRHMGSDYRVHIDGKDLTPQEISAMILAKIRRDAESYLGEPVTEAVITVPAYFDDSQRKATQDAGRIAGLNVLRIINEPTAAAVAYGLDNEASQKILVYDLGGGTFDVSIIEIEDGTFTVLATGGDTHLGGDDFDQRIVEYAVAEFKKSDRIDLSRDPAAMGRLKEEAEKAKKELSAAPSAQLNLPFIAVGKDGPHHLDISLSRPQFEMMTGDLLARTVAPVQNALRDAGISASQLGKVLLVGGSTRMPAVERQVRELLGFRRISTAVTVDAINTDMSVSICPASTSNASDPVMMAPTISATNTVPVKVSVIISRRWCALLPRVTSFTVPCMCGIVYLSFCLLCETVSYNHFQ